MVYAEWLRIRNCLRGYGYVFLALFVIAAIFRIGFNSQLDTRHWLDESRVHGAHTSVTTLGNGVVRTTIDSPDNNHTHIVLDDHGWFGKRVTVTRGVTGPQVEQHSTSRNGFGLVSVSQSTTQNSSTTTIDTVAHPIDVGFLLLFTVMSGLIMATILGAPLARENGDHLEIVFTKPASRARFALDTVLTDFVGILGSMVLTLIFMLAVLALVQVPLLTISATGAWMGLSAILLTFAWYAMYLAVSSSMKRARGAVLGLAWPISYGILGVAVIPMGETEVGRVFHTIFHWLAVLNPLAYMQTFEFNSDSPTLGHAGIFSLEPPVAALALLVMIVAYVAIGIAQWQRVEA